MNPINPNNKVFSDDFHKFVLQDQKPVGPPQEIIHVERKFSIDPPVSTKKGKKSDKKEKSPWLPKQKKTEESEEEI